MTDLRSTSRGFRIFVGTSNTSVMVVESSMAFEGAHAHIYGGYQKDEHVQLSVVHAKIVIRGLQAFVSEAEAGLLTEPAMPEAEEAES